MAEEIVVSDKKSIEEANSEVRAQLGTLLQHYRNFFTAVQIEALIMFWYGYAVEEIAEALELNEEIVYEWRETPQYKQAIIQGLGRKDEVLIHSMERSAFKAMKMIDSALSTEIDPSEKGFGEIIKTARWLLDKVDFNPNKEETQESSAGMARMDEGTAKIIAEEVARITGQRVSVADPKDFFKEEIIDAEEIKLSSYYRIIAKGDNALVESSLINVRKEEGEWVMQCHLCGKWKSALSGHIGIVHKEMGVTRYRAHFGLPRHVPLTVNEEFLEAIKESDIVEQNQ